MEVNDGAQNVNESRARRVHARTGKRCAPVTSDEVVQAIEDLTLRGRGPTEIHRLLKARPDLRGKVPGLRTVKKYAVAAKRTEPSGPWRLATADPDEAAVVVPILATVLEQSTVRGISKAEAAMIARIVRAAPDIDGWDAYRLARKLLTDPSADADVQAYLAFAPWRDRGGRYARAYADGLIRSVIYRYETPGEALRGHRGGDDR